MKTEDIVCNADNLFAASKKVIASSPKKQTTIFFKQKRLTEIKRAQEELRSRTWKIKPMKPFVLNERGHRRKIVGNTPYDRMIIHSYLDYGLEPLLEKYLIHDNYASQIGKGTDYARKRFKDQLHSAYREYGHNRFYVLMIDFAKFYDNVQHEKLKKAILAKIPYEEFHEYMLDAILDSMKVDVSHMTDEEYANCMNTKYSALDHMDETKRGKRYMAKGLQIGNQASQLFSIFFPTQIDTYCRCVLGCKRHGRYMDDTEIISDSKEFLRKAAAGIAERAKELGIFIHERKTQIHRIDRGVKYLNRVYHMSETGHVFEYLHGQTITRQRRKLKKLRAMVEDGTIPYAKAQDQYRSWMGNFYRYMSKEQRRRMNDLYNELFIKEWRNQT